MKNNIVVNKNINVMTPDLRRKYLPFSILRYLTGGRITPNYRKLHDTVCIEWADGKQFLHAKDFAIVKQVGDAIWKEVVQAKNMLPVLMTLPTAIVILEEAQKRVDRVADDAKGKKRVILVKDQSGCGYWRMEIPAQYMNLDSLFIECTQVEIAYDMLLEYDTIVVQRTHQWDHYYILKRLKEVGKRIIYDIDDDIFNLPPQNPASTVIKPDQIAAARAIMELCDVLTTPSEVIKERFALQDKTVVIPNAIDLQDDWIPLTGSSADLKSIGSVDGFRRILWQGSASHEADWYVVIDAIDNLFKKYDDLRLVVLGYMPRCIRERLERREPHWMNRIEYSDFMNVETYVHIMHNIRAEVGIAPLLEDVFNRAKSPLKVVEYAAACIPCVASNIVPYKGVITDGKDGYLASTPEEWEQKIDDLLMSPQKRLDMVWACRELVERDYNIHKIVKDWQTLFLQ